MKKILLTLMIAACVTTAFAKDEVSRKAVESFKSEFKYAKNVSWISTGDYVKASFTEMDVKMEAFYTPAGELIGVSRAVSMENLPGKSGSYITKRYAGYTVAEVIEFDSVEDGKSVYVAVESAKERLILNVSTDGAISVFKRISK